jgi:hypothetical protein
MPTAEFCPEVFDDDEPVKKKRRPRGQGRKGSRKLANGGGGGEQVPLAPLDLPDDAAMSPAMMRKKDESTKDLFGSFEQIECQRQLLLASGLAITPISVSTITLECTLSGPVLTVAELSRRLKDTDVIEFNMSTLGKQPDIADTRKFNNAFILQVCPRLCLHLVHPT